MQTVQHTKHFAHPANWAGFLLIGGNIRISNKVALIGQALCELIKAPDKCRDALRVCLHLVRFLHVYYSKAISIKISFAGGKKFTKNSSWSKECHVYNAKKY